MASTAWRGTDVKVTSGSRTVEVTRNADTDDISKVKVNGNFVASNFSLPYEVERTYTTGETDFIVLKELWQGASGSGLNAVVATSPATIEEARLALVNLISIYESFADNVSPAVTGNSVVQRTSNGRIKASAGVAADEVVVQSQLGTAASKNVGTSAGNVMEVGAFGTGLTDASPWPRTSLNDVSGLPTASYGGYLSSVSTADGWPFNASAINYTLQHYVERENAGVQILEIQRLNTGAVNQIFVRNFYNSAFLPWAELYHSGNSVNPLDYGLGSPTKSSPFSLTRSEGGFYEDGANVHFVGNRDTAARVFEIYGSAGGSSTADIYARHYDATSQTVFYNVELYHSGNTNFNEFGGSVADSEFYGHNASPTLSIVYQALNSKTAPTGISVVGTWSLVRYNGNIIRSGITSSDISFSGNSGTRLLRVLISNSSSLVEGESVELRAETSSSKITVNF